MFRDKAALVAAITLFCAMGAQIGYGVWWASSLSTRLAVTEEWIKKNDDTRTRLTVLESKLDDTHAAVDKIGEVAGRIEVMLGGPDPVPPPQPKKKVW